MCTCQSLIKTGLRKLGELESGRDPPANEAADALQSLKGLYKHLVATGTLGRLTDVLTAANYTAKENERVINTSGGAITITLPTTVNDLNGYGVPGAGTIYDYGFCGSPSGLRPPRDRSIVVKAGSAPTTWIYDADLAVWVNIDGLTLTAEAPFTQKLETGMAALFAVHIASEYSDSTPPQTVVIAAAQCMAALTSRPDSGATVTASESF